MAHHRSGSPLSEVSIDQQLQLHYKAKLQKFHAQNESNIAALQAVQALAETLHMKIGRLEKKVSKTITVLRTALAEYRPEPPEELYRPPILDEGGRGRTGSF